jgi:hypothetical protein
MPGYKKQKVHVYYEDGSKHSEHESEAAFAENFKVVPNYLSIERKFRFGEDVVKIFETGLYASNEAIGRIRMCNYVRKINSKFIKLKDTDDRKINCYNLDDELVATFKGLFHAKAFIGKNISVNKVKPEYPRGELYFIWGK